MQNVYILPKIAVTANLPWSLAGRYPFLVLHYIQQIKESHSLGMYIGVECSCAEVRVMVKENLTKMSSVEMESKNVDVYVWLVKYLREVC